MNAVVSGHSGVALLIDGETFSSMHFGEDEVRQRRPGDFRLLFNGAQDLQFLEDVDLAEVRQRLDLESTRIDALHLALILLDRELEHDTRRTAAEELEELLTDEGTARWVEGVLHARPLPRSGDLVGARSACTGRTPRTRAFLGKLESLQPVIAEIHEAWERIPTHLFGTDDERQRVLSVVVREGLFRDLVALRADGRSMDDFVAQSLTRPALGELVNARQVLEAWGAALDHLDEGVVPTPTPSTVSYVAENSPRIYWDNLEPSFMDTPEELFRRYHRPLLAFFFRRGFSVEESRDLTQETFLRAFKHMDGFRGESSLETWLFQVASNLYKNWLRASASQKRGAHEVPLKEEEVAASVQADTTLTKERVKRLHEALEDLPPQMRQALFLHVDRDLKYREIAEIMHVSIDTVKRDLYKARQQLRARLVGYFFEHKL